MITLYFANVGTGKTTLAARIVQKEYKKICKGKSKYKNIVCNANIKNSIFVENIHVLSKNVLEDSLIIIDEASIEYNNRLMNMHKNEIRFFKLHRHYNCDLIFISQSWEDIDITIRRLYTNMYLLKKLPFHLTMMRRIKKYITVDENDQIIEGYKLCSIPFLDIKFFYRKKWYSFFDSYWRPKDIALIDVNDINNIDNTEVKKIRKIL